MVCAAYHFDGSLCHVLGQARGEETAMTDAEPDTEHEGRTQSQATVDVLVQLSFLVQGVLGRIAAEHDLSLTQVRLLGILRDRRPGMLELARHLGLDKSSMTGLVARAEKRGLVRR